MRLAALALAELIKAGYTRIINDGACDEQHSALYDLTDDPAE